MEVHFYPGQKLLVVKEVVKEIVKGVEKEKEVVKGRFEAWGGPSIPGSDPHMREIPTTAGIYVT
ncbi:MAG: hypothetical protein [Olavius algarvensis Gamma 1 endosymbiont]|nr:MAG: hypothetical protein [Olavius algarvensis Gamma 1 endosymbiont]